MYYSSLVIAVTHRPDSQREWSALGKADEREGEDGEAAAGQATTHR